MFHANHVILNKTEGFSTFKLLAVKNFEFQLNIAYLPFRAAEMQTKL